MFVFEGHGRGSKFIRPPVFTNTSAVIDTSLGKPQAVGIR